MAKWQRRSLDFKRRVVARMRKCENVGALARELKLGRSLLYQWKLQLEGRPEPQRADLSQSRVGAAEKKLREENRLLKEALGEKALEADFFAGALRRIEEQRRKRTTSGAIAAGAPAALWTIETGLLNAEVLSQQTKTDTPDPNIHLTMAFRSLTDDSRSLILANRYEARLQRLYDRAYKTLRELQQTRKSEPTPPRTVHIRWVDPNEDPDQPADVLRPTSNNRQPTSVLQPKRKRGG